ncbi:MAG: succinylglutamate desuccinylase [Gammaproteobacteria bacterium]|nr:succinylglutamate desuccinylase [Gammaproteobacteria bacterium]
MLLISINVKAQNDSGVFYIADIEVNAGETYRGFLEVPAMQNDPGTVIPITIHNGSSPGPTLSLIAGIHGSEYSPILSMQKVSELIDPTELAGTLVIVHIANMPAFTGRTIYFGPQDRKNLNRSFPGDPEGTVTERVAHVLTTEIIDKSDYMLDIHSGDANESLRPSYSAYYAEAGGKEVIAESRRIAIAFGLETIVQFAGDYDSLDEAIYTSAQAVKRGVASMDVESGELGMIDDSYINPITNGVLNVMRELEMIAGEPYLPTNPLFINDRARIYSEHNGIWYADPLVKTGDYVSEGTALGVITDYHGNELETVRAPASGVLLILFGTPPVNEGDNIVVVGKVMN